MNHNFVFSQHVSDLVRGKVTGEELEAPWKKLRDALMSEMRQRSLLTASPTCLGIYGFASWTQEALDELTTDCYTSVFLRRLPSLAAQLKRKSNVEGLVFRNIGFYLHEIQRRHDPVGFRVYRVLRAAVCEAVERKVLRIEQGGTAVRNDTVLTMSKFPPGEAELDGLRRDGVALESAVRRWSEELLPDLITARGTAVDPIVATLTECLTRLADEGVSTFRFQDVSKLLKDHVRSRWRTLWAHDQGRSEDDRKAADLAQAVRPPTSYEEREAFEKLVACVGEALENVPTSTRTRSYLHRLWVFLWSHTVEDGGALPSQRRISEHLEIPRARLAELYATLGQTVELCQEVHSGQKARKGPSHGVQKKVEVM